MSELFAKRGLRDFSIYTRGAPVRNSDRLAERPSVEALVQRVPGLEVQHGHVADPVGHEVYEHEVVELLARDLEHAHAGRGDQPFPRAVVVLQRDRGRRHAQYVLALLVARLRAHPHAPFRELDPFDLGAARHQAALAHDPGDAAVEALACGQG